MAVMSCSNVSASRISSSSSSSLDHDEAAAAAGAAAAQQDVKNAVEAIAAAGFVRRRKELDREVVTKVEQAALAMRAKGATVNNNKTYKALLEILKQHTHLTSFQPLLFTQSMDVDLVAGGTDNSTSSSSSSSSSETVLPSNHWQALQFSTLYTARKELMDNNVLSGNTINSLRYLHMGPRSTKADESPVYIRFNESERRQMEANGDPRTVLSYDTVLGERNRRVEMRTRKRIKQIDQLLAANELPTFQLKKLKIEKLQLELSGFQQSLRGDIVQNMVESANDRGCNKMELRKTRTKFFKLYPHTKVNALRTRKSDKVARRKQFLADVLEHAGRFKMAHSQIEESRQELAKSVLSHFQNKERLARAQAERDDRARLMALKANDEEAYYKLVKESKNKRIKILLKQTDDCLKNLASRVNRARGEAGFVKRDTSRKTDEEKERRKQRRLADQKEVKENQARVSKELNDEDEEDESESSKLGEQVDVMQSKQAYHDLVHQVTETIEKQPDILVGGTLKSYQLEGLRWMISLYNNRLNGILADEMGLGKTVQTIALISYLYETKNIAGPHLIIVPLSTLSNWMNEFAHWCPTLKVIKFHGSQAERRYIKEHELKQEFNVVLTTNEVVMNDRATLSRFSWVYMIVDEGHRLKNSKCKLTNILTNSYTTEHRMLLTGTPLQNSLKELWALLNFTLPQVFNSSVGFETWFVQPVNKTLSKDMAMTEEETLLVINRLHNVLQPFLLRRVKKDVEKELPEKVEKVLKCHMSAWQVALHRQVQGSGITEVDSNGKISASSLSNTIVQIRKVCNHPYLFYEPGPITDEIWRCSGKFELLDRILPKMKATNHRILMFCTMKRLMYIMADYLDYRGYKYLQLDGGTSGDDRAEMLKVFNAPDSEYFVFLMTTKAGGVGLNLQTADTVILFDSDWNPQNDLQAQARAHRRELKRD
eukprot:TRINITY_DN1471_c0_g1_i21.p1 TRINITY_DN1471_c0_g1~~TRINITY_DN1471_c0_g1_i21.p1  ORF type:complete len:941 (-),score=329.76 TRINITY_DN1471_c0_g1_i21:86-2908(-)